MLLRLVTQQMLLVVELLATVWVATYMQRSCQYQVVTNSLLLPLALTVATNNLPRWLTPTVLNTVQHLKYVSTEMKGLTTLLSARYCTQRFWYPNLCVNTMLHSCHIYRLSTRLRYLEVDQALEH